MYTTTVAPPRTPMWSSLWLHKNVVCFSVNEDTDDLFWKVSFRRGGGGGRGEEKWNGRETCLWHPCFFLGKELASYLPMTWLCCSLGPQAGHFLGAGSCVRELGSPSELWLTRQGSKNGRAQSPSFKYQNKQLEVSAGSEMQTCGELTWAWNGSLYGVSNLSSLLIYDLWCWARPWRLISKEARSPTYFPIGLLSAQYSPWEVRQRKYRTQRVLLERPKANSQTKRESLILYRFLICSSPDLFIFYFFILFHIILHILDSIVYYFPNSNIEKLARICKTNYRRTK